MPVQPTTKLDLATIRERLSRHAPAVLTGPSERSASKHAAVATILRESQRGPEVLLIRRAEHPQDPWSGHMAFPGGRHDDRDEDLFATAVRETLEEVSLDLRQTAELIGRLGDLPAFARGRATGLVISPFVFVLHQHPALCLNPEVSEILWAPLHPMMRGELATTYAYSIEGKRIELPAHDVDGRIVWGLTHRMLDSLFALLG